MWLMSCLGSHVLTRTLRVATVPNHLLERDDTNNPLFLRRPVAILLNHKQCQKYSLSQFPRQGLVVLLA